MSEPLISNDVSNSRLWDILALGNPCMDIVFAAERLPASGEKVLGQPLGRFPGGTEANVACAVAKLGRSAAIYGQVGDDAAARELTASFEECGVDTQHLYVQTSAQSACAITALSSSGERGIVYLPMPSAPRAAGLEDALRQARVLYTMPYDLEDLVTTSHTARQVGALVAIDLEAAVAPDAQGMWRRIEQADVVFFNESGFMATVGKAPTEETMRSVLQVGPRTAVVTLGAGGAMVVDAHTYAHQPAFAGPVVDTTGAGDTFNAAFLVALLEGQSSHQALRFACAAASCTIAAVGARPGMPTRAEVAAVLLAAQTRLEPAC